MNEVAGTRNVPEFLSRLLPWTKFRPWWVAADARFFLAPRWLPTLLDQALRLRRPDAPESRRACADPKTSGYARQCPAPPCHVPGYEKICRFDWPYRSGGQATCVLIPRATTAALIRCGWLNTSNPSLRAIAASVMPAASAIRTAKAVGADTATISGAPIALA